MYARLVMFTMGPGKRAVAEKMADQFLGAMQGLKGFKGSTFIVDEAVGEYGALSLWESKEALEAALETLTPGLQQALEGIVQGPPIRRTFEVYEPVVAGR